jgi:uncharacterized protein YbjT (DUF2867 family)
MKVLLFGASGMVGQGVLRECLSAYDVTLVRAIGRAPLTQTHAKLESVVRADLFEWAGAEAMLSGFDACFFCLGVSSGGMSEAAYTKVTYELTLAVAQAFAKANPGATFIYVSGAGTDSSEQGRSMWARVKGRTENALLALPLKAVMFRPWGIQPMHGITSRTLSYRVLYTLLSPITPLLRAAFPRFITTTERLGRAMLVVARQGSAKPVLENHEIDALAGPR